MKKRIFSMLVAICLVLSMIPTVSGTAFASTTYVSDSDVTYEVDGGNIYFDASTGTITGCDKRVTSAEIPDSVTGIAANAFGGCSNLQYIVGKKGSYAEQYANENNIPFVATHTHCVCGAEHKNIGDHTAENSITFTAWTDTLAEEQNGEGKTAANSLPSVAGNYYLTEDVTLTETWKPTDNTVLCLGGYEVSISLGKYTTYTEVVCVEDGIKFTLADCSTEQGKIKGINHDDINQTLRIKGAGSFEMYGGSIEGAGLDIFHPIFGIQLGDNHDDKNAQFNMYGGSIANVRYGIRVRDTLNMYGGNINDCVEYGVEFDNLDHATTATMSGGSIHDCGCGVFMGNSDITFSMSGGSIKNNGKDEKSSYKPSHSGGVYSWANAIFNLSGGTIEGNVNDQDLGAGVCGGTFNMSGGSVKNNIGGGVRASNITLSGSAQIVNNTLNDKTITENLRVYSDRTITINSLSETAKIGITTETAPTAGNPVTFTSNAASNFDGKLFSDNAAYEISANDDGTLALKIKKVNPTLTIPTATATYGQKLSDISLTNPSGNTEGTWEWMDRTQSVGDASDIPKTFKAKFIPSDTRTYNTVENIDISVTVNPKPLTNNMLRIDSEQAEYKGSAVDVKFTVYDGETLLVKGSDYEITSGGKANAVEATTLTIKGLGNYTGEATATWSPKKVNIAEIISEDTVPGISIVISDDCEDGKLSFTLETDETMQEGLTYMVWVSKKDAEFEDWQLVSAQDGVYSADLGENEIEVHAYILGDVNMDGKLNVGDSSDILRSIANDSNLSGLQSAQTDFNSDGNINVGDVSDMLRFIANS